jgi:ribonuclease HI
MKFMVYTDGGCSGNKRDAGCYGAWSFLILDPSNTVIYKNAALVSNTTNNQMEMKAVIMGTRFLKTELDAHYTGAKNHDCVIVSDSNYVVEGWNVYMHDWKRFNWRKSKGGVVANLELWKEIDSLSPEFKSFTILWVKGHSINKFNTEADSLVRNLLYT